MEGKEGTVVGSLEHQNSLVLSTITRIPIDIYLYLSVSLSVLMICTSFV